MASILQANMCRSSTAFGLIEIMVEESKINILLLSEIGRMRKDHTNWITDKLNNAALWTIRDLGISNEGSGNDIVWDKYGCITYVSCYSNEVDYFNVHPEELEDTLKEFGGSIIIGRDLNSHALE